jgi:DNA-binding IclR family transcriptional regulator
MQHDEDKRDGGVQSVEVAGTILRAMIALQGPASLTDIARNAGIHPSKVHRYLLSLIRIELVEQDVARGRYGPGPLAVSLGLARLRDLDFVSIAAPRLAVLRDSTNETTVLTMWSDHGPVVLKLEESGRPIFLNVRVGSTLPLCKSATGQVFAAFLPPTRAKELIDQELPSPEARRAFWEQIAAVKVSRLGRVQGAIVPGVSALAAPIFNVDDQIVAAIGLLGRDVDLDVSLTGSAASALIETAKSISERLGSMYYDSTTQAQADDVRPRKKRSRHARTRVGGLDE